MERCRQVERGAVAACLPGTRAAAASACNLCAGWLWNWFCFGDVRRDQGVAYRDEPQRQAAPGSAGADVQEPAQDSDRRTGGG